MLNNPEITTQPLFYLFIGVTVLLSLGYTWGRRRNKRIFVTAFDDLTGILKPRDQQFTNIGGITGYHANFIPNKSSVLRRADVTITLLPRQSWLWYPFSRVTRRFDRLFLTFELAKNRFGTLKEGHIIEKRYAKLPGAMIENEDRLGRQEFTWGGREYALLYEDAEIKAALLRCKEQLGEPETLRHLALVPERERIFLFMIPKIGTVGKTVAPIYQWFHQLLKSG